MTGKPQNKLLKIGISLIIFLSFDVAGDVAYISEETTPTVAGFSEQEVAQVHALKEFVFSRMRSIKAEHKTGDLFFKILAWKKLHTHPLTPSTDHKTIEKDLKESRHKGRFLWKCRAIACKKEKGLGNCLLNYTYVLGLRINPRDVFKRFKMQHPKCYKNATQKNLNLCKAYLNKAEAHLKKDVRLHDFILNHYAGCILEASSDPLPLDHMYFYCLYYGQKSTGLDLHKNQGKQIKRSFIKNVNVCMQNFGYQPTLPQSFKDAQGREWFFIRRPHEAEVAVTPEVYDAYMKKKAAEKSVH